ncbi:hypothetical protein OSB04_007863 [Centaurea solstitialis]|uniref:Uncharacterized protein n=1 Tax=Centaurea solstitialis TaxID=347529 RepID=A0AA38U569_9ASTR|nr:hypothetical protein OSB04_007863 [Centaurea solstitialis]
MKSLFLHMSRHSDSEWREILPEDIRNAVVIVRRTLFPVSVASDSSESESDDGLESDDDGGDHQVVDLTKFPPAVKKTGKRGRPGRRFGSPEKMVVRNF